jgi:hypothetical protein
LSDMAPASTAGAAVAVPMVSALPMASKATVMPATGTTPIHPHPRADLPDKNIDPSVSPFRYPIK